jgi:hypothetical protein
MESEKIAGEFIKLDNGYIGLGAGKPVVGDKLFILNSSPVPWILRHNEISSNTSTSTTRRGIGWAYVNGIMDGEAMPMIESGEKPMVDVFIN